MSWVWLWSALKAVVAAIAALFPHASPPNVPQDPPVALQEPPTATTTPDVPPSPPVPPTPLLRPFCLYIQSREGYFKPGANRLYPNGTPAWRNNNPGNLKMGPFAKSCGAFSQDASGFAVFHTYDEGFAALETLVRNAATGKSTSYKPTMTLLEFFETYSPAADKNDPKSYAREVGFKLGVDYRTFQIKDLL